MTIQAWKYYNKQLPSAIDNNLERRNIAHELRHDSLIKLPRITSSSDKNQFDYNLCNAINKLDLLIKNVRNLKSLKLFTKTRLVAKYKNINPNNILYIQVYTHDCLKRNDEKNVGKVFSNFEIGQK